MSQKKKMFRIIIILLAFTSCEFFKSNKISQKDIKTASSWTSNDERPSFSECEDLNKNENIDCFNLVVTEAILTYMKQNMVDLNIDIDEQIKLFIKIDKEGYFSLGSIDASDFLKDNIQDFEILIENAIYNIPQALPALKVNVEEYVNIKLTLPIRILTTS